MSLYTVSPATKKRARRSLVVFPPLCSTVISQSMQMQGTEQTHKARNRWLCRVSSLLNSCNSTPHILITSICRHYRVSCNWSWAFAYLVLAWVDCCSFRRSKPDSRGCHTYVCTAWSGERASSQLVYYVACVPCRDTIWVQYDIFEMPTLQKPINQVTMRITGRNGRMRPGPGCASLALCFPFLSAVQWLVNQCRCRERSRLTRLGTGDCVALARCSIPAIPPRTFW